MLGGNPTLMRSLAQRMDVESQQLEATFRALSGKLAGTAWQGPDAQGFRERWDAHHRAKLSRVIRELRDAAATLRQEAVAQERISNP